MSRSRARDGAAELETLTEPALRELIERGSTTVVVPFGSIENHGAHLPIGADALLADWVGRRVAARVGAVLAPTVRIGHGARHQLVSVRTQALTQLALDVAAALAGLGFRVIALTSAHDGNAEPLQAAVACGARTFGDAVVCVPSADVGPDPGSYSGEWLTSVMLAIAPELVDRGRAAPALAAEVSRASAARGAAHLERFVTSIADAVISARAR